MDVLVEEEDWTWCPNYFMQRVKETEGRSETSSNLENMAVDEEDKVPPDSDPGSGRRSGEVKGGVENERPIENSHTDGAGHEESFHFPKHGDTSNGNKVITRENATSDQGDPHDFVGSEQTNGANQESGPSPMEIQNDVLNSGPLSTQQTHLTHQNQGPKKRKREEQKKKEKGEFGA